MNLKMRMCFQFFVAKDQRPKTCEIRIYEKNRENLVGHEFSDKLEISDNYAESNRLAAKRARDNIMIMI